MVALQSHVQAVGNALKHRRDDVAQTLTVTSTAAPTGATSANNSIKFHEPSETVKALVGVIVIVVVFLLGTHPDIFL
jgi:hypothetical protein